MMHWASSNATAKFSQLLFSTRATARRSISTPPAVADATAKLSKLLAAARGRRALDDALGFLKREPSSKTILSTTNSKAYRCLLGTSPSKPLPRAPSSSASEPDGGESAEDLAASMRLVRSYAARVKWMPPSPRHPPASGGNETFVVYRVAPGDRAPRRALHARPFVGGTGVPRS